MKLWHKWQQFQKKRKKKKTLERVNNSHTSIQNICRLIIFQGKMYLILSILIIIIVNIDIINGNVISYNGDGEWVKPESPDSQECKQYLCTPSGHIWKQKTNPLKLYNNVTGCDALVAKGIKKILFYGDSYLRHVYAAMLITLNGNYESGSMADPKKDENCKYHELFNEKRCNYFNLNHYGTVCDNRLYLDPLLTDFNDKECGKKEDGTVALWSVGNHAIGKGRYGVNNAVAYKDQFLKGNCPTLLNNKEIYTGTADGTHKCSIWWLSTHQRLQQHYPDESPEQIQQYNLDMRQFMESGDCGNVNYIDVFNMTDSLTMQHREESHRLTWDKVHWSMEVNLIKAQIIINALLSTATTP